MTVYDDYRAILGNDFGNHPVSRSLVHIECTDECKATRVKWITDFATYAAKWTKHCRHCGGRGGHVYHDDPGATDCSLPGGLMEFDEPCEHCLEHGICPRCGKLAWPDDAFEQETLICPHCGWNEDKAAEMAAPVEPECFCYERYI